MDPPSPTSELTSIGAELSEEELKRQKRREQQQRATAYEVTGARASEILIRNRNSNKFETVFKFTNFKASDLNGLVSCTTYTFAERTMKPWMLYSLVPLVKRTTLNTWKLEALTDHKTVADVDLVDGFMKDWGFDGIIVCRFRNGRMMLLPTQAKLKIGKGGTPNLTGWLLALGALIAKCAGDEANVFAGVGLLQMNDSQRLSLQMCQLMYKSLPFGIQYVKEEFVTPEVRAAREAADKPLRAWQQTTLPLVEAHNAKARFSTIQSATGTGKGRIIQEQMDNALVDASVTFAVVLTPRLDLVKQLIETMRWLKNTSEVGREVRNLSCTGSTDLDFLETYTASSMDKLECGDYATALASMPKEAVVGTQKTGALLLDRLLRPEMHHVVSRLVLILDEVDFSMPFLTKALQLLPLGARILGLTATLSTDNVIGDKTRYPEFADAMEVEEEEEEDDEEDEEDDDKDDDEDDDASAKGAPKGNEWYEQRAQCFHKGKLVKPDAGNDGQLSVEQQLYDSVVPGAGLTYEQALTVNQVAPVQFLAIANAEGTDLIDTLSVEAGAKAWLDLIEGPDVMHVDRGTRGLFFTNGIHEADDQVKANVAEAAKRKLTTWDRRVTSGRDATEDRAAVPGVTDSQREALCTTLCTGPLAGPTTTTFGMVNAVPCAYTIVAADMMRRGTNVTTVNMLAIRVTETTSANEVIQCIGRGTRLPDPVKVLILGRPDDVRRMLGLLQRTFPTALGNVVYTTDDVATNAHVSFERVLALQNAMRTTVPPLTDEERTDVAKGGNRGKRVAAALGALKTATEATMAATTAHEMQTLVDPRNLIGNADVATFVQHVDKCVTDGKVVTSKWHRKCRNKLIAQFEGKAEWLPPDVFATQLHRLETVGLVDKYFQAVKAKPSYTEAEMADKLVGLVYVHGGCTMPKVVKSDSTDYGFVHNSASKVLVYLETQTNLDETHAAVRDWLRKHVEVKATKDKPLTIDEKALVIKELLVNDDPSRNQVRPATDIAWTIVPNADDVPAVVDESNLVFHVPGFTRRVTTKFGKWLADRRIKIPPGNLLTAFTTGCLSPYFYQTDTGFDFRPEFNVKVSARGQASVAGKKRVAAGGVPTGHKKAKEAKGASSSMDAA